MWPDAPSAGAVGADDADPAARGAPPEPHPLLGDGRDRIRGRVWAARARPAPPGRPPARRRLAAPARDPRRRCRPRGTSTASASQRAWRPASSSRSPSEPALRRRSIASQGGRSSRCHASMGLVGRAQPVAAHPPLQPVHATRRGDARGPQVGEEVLGLAASDGGAQQRDQPGAGQRPGHRQVGLDGDRDPEAGEHAPQQRPRAATGRGRRSPLLRGDVAVEQLRDLRPDRLGLGQLPGRASSARPPSFSIGSPGPRRSGARARTASGCA